MAKKLTLTWGEDLYLESKLKRHKTKYRVAKIRLNEIDWNWSLDNQARQQDRLVEDRALEYALAMTAGNVFPRIAVKRLQNGLYGIMSGNHRAKGLELFADDQSKAYADVELEVYRVTDNRDWLHDMIVRSANRGLGDRTSAREAVFHCRHMIDKHGRPLDECAMEFGVRPEWIRNAIKCEETRDKLEALEVAAEGLNHTVLKELRRVEANDSHLRKAGHLAAAYGLTGDAAHQMCEEVQRTTTQTEGNRVLKKWDDQLRAKKPGVHANEKRRKTARSRLLRPISTLANMIDQGNKGGPFANLEEMGVDTEAELDEIFERYTHLRTVLDKMFREQQKKFQSIRANMRKSQRPANTTKRRAKKKQKK